MKINNLKIQREKMGLTQVQVAEKAGIQTTSYQRYEVGKRLPNVQTAMLIAKCLNSTCEELFKKE